MFTTPCFVRCNTPELKEWLKEIGYEQWNNFDVPEYPIIETFYLCNKPTFCNNSGNNIFPLVNDGLINCQSNVDLFKALAAMRNDSDYMQWFIFDKDVYDIEDDFIAGNTLLFKKGDWYLCRDYRMISKKNIHKATKEELIKYFTK